MARPVHRATPAPVDGTAFSAALHAVSSILRAHFRSAVLSVAIVVLTIAVPRLTLIVLAMTYANHAYAQN
jgi:hypothetical protein